MVGAVAFSADGTKYGYVGNTATDSVVIVNGAEIARHQGARAFGPYFGPGNRVAYILQEGIRSYLVLDGSRQGPYAAAGYPLFSANGQHAAYGVVDGLTQRSRVVVDGVPSQLYAVNSIPSFRGDNIVEYYAATSDSQVVTVFKVRKTL
jgi:hypothetical protein